MDWRNIDRFSIPFSIPEAPEKKLKYLWIRTTYINFNLTKKSGNNEISFKTPPSKHCVPSIFSTVKAVRNILISIAPVPN